MSRNDQMIVNMLEQLGEKQQTIAAKDAELAAQAQRITELETSFVCPIEAICEAAKARVVELERDFNNAEIRMRNAEARMDAAIEERDEYRASAEKVAAVHVAIVTERDAAIASEQRLRAALERLYRSYKALADSGDCGFWKLEDTDEGKQAVAVLAEGSDFRE